MNGDALVSLCGLTIPPDPSRVAAATLALGHVDAEALITLEKMACAITSEAV